jgi:hypothetical protein
MILFYLTLPLKFILIGLLGAVRIFQARIPKGSYFNKPDEEIIRKDMLRLKSICTDYLMPGKNLGASYVTRRTFSNVRGVPDHQAIRHGALAWADPSTHIIEGATNFVDKNSSFTRAATGHDDPTTPIEAAVGACLSITQGPISRKARNIFVRAVIQQIRNNFTVYNGNSYGRRKALSTGVDAIFFGSVLATGYLLSGRKIFKKLFYKKLLLEMWAPLFLFPITYHAANRRLYFIEYTCVAALSIIIKAFNPKLAKLSMRFVAAQSYKHANPMFAALMKQSGVDNQKLFSFVLHNSAEADLHSASLIGSEQPAEAGIINWSQVNRDEFLFDDFPSNRRVGEVLGVNPLNGLSYGRSLQVLLK